VISVTIDELRHWLKMWARKYDAILDESISDYEGRSVLSGTELEHILRWVADRTRQSPQPIPGAFAAELVPEYTSRAIGSNDDLAALLILNDLPLGITDASGVLASMRPGVFSVFQSSSLAALQEQGYVSPLSPFALDTRGWLPYLKTTRRLARETGVSLQLVDRALNEAGRKIPPR